MPISAILFGGRRASVVPLVFQSHDWEHGVFLGSIMASETTAAQAGAVGNLRRDPFAMLPFCGYNMADYFAHWLQIGAEAPNRDALPKIFYVNWFRKDADGKFLWPGYGENSRVLEWIFDRVLDKAPAVDTPIGAVPTPEAIDTDRPRREQRPDGRAPAGRHRGLAGGGPPHQGVLRPVRRPPSPGAGRSGRDARASAWADGRARRRRRYPRPISPISR